MSRAWKLIAGALALVAVWWVVQMLAAESGEVVVVTTRDAAEEPHETRLWVVDHRGRAWLRAGSEIAGWYGRLRERPRIAVERDSERELYLARPEPGERDEVNRLMAEKYGWAESYIGFFIPRDRAIPIRLEPIPAP